MERSTVGRREAGFGSGCWVIPILRAVHTFIHPIPITNIMAAGMPVVRIIMADLTAADIMGVAEIVADAGAVIIDGLERVATAYLRLISG